MAKQLKINWKICEKRKLLLLVLFCSIIFISGCRTATSSPFSTEVQGRFYTTDLATAQSKIPFHIILPTYIPGNGHNMPSPVIDGPLDSESTNDKIDVNIKYDVDIGEPKTAMIQITETNRNLSLGDVQLDPDLEVINIAGIEVTKSKDGFSETNTYFSFDHDSIFYLVEMHLFDNENSFKIDEESLKIVESMINILPK